MLWKKAHDNENCRVPKVHLGGITVSVNFPSSCSPHLGHEILSRESSRILETGSETDGGTNSRSNQTKIQRSHLERAHSSLPKQRSDRSRMVLEQRNQQQNLLPLGTQAVTRSPPRTVLYPAATADPALCGNTASYMCYVCCSRASRG